MTRNLAFLAVLLAGCLILLSLAATSAHTGSAWRALPESDFATMVPAAPGSAGQLCGSTAERHSGLCAAVEVAGSSPALASSTPPSGPRPTANPRLTMPKLAVPPCCIVPPAGGIKGQATWFASLGSWLYGAAGPRLRAAIGPGYLGRTVRVCAALRCVSVRLVTSCACQPDTRLIDLSLDAFSRLAAPSRGVIAIVVSW